MSALSKIGVDLCTWYGETMARLDKIDKLEKCELLLCARDLEVETPAFVFPLTLPLRAVFAFGYTWNLQKK